MYAFSNWCFLCARENNADIEIQWLPAKMQEKIGEYSLVNYNLPGCPKNICSKCHNFLIDVENYTKRYEVVEKCLMELMRNKTADVKEIRNKYAITNDLDEIETNEVIFEIVNTEKEVPQLSSTAVIEEHFEVVSPAKSTTSVRILNPTLPPKIENKVRLDLLTCDLCAHTTSTINLMNRHMELHINNKKLFRCNVCHKRFADKRVLETHLATTHATSQERKKYECKDCGKFLSSQTAVNNHMKWFHTAREFSCETCHKKFATKGSLNEHTKIHSNIKQHVCPICSKEFKTASSLTNHIDTHSLTEYKCSICDLKLNSKRTLRQHEKVHSNIIEHKCEICGAEFKRTKTFKDHLMTHSKIRPYVCEFCGKTFTNGPNCRKHKRDSHPAELAKAEKNGTSKKPTKLPKIEELLSLSAS